MLLHAIRSSLFTLVGSVLTVTDATAEFDFTLSGAAPVAATQVVAFNRS